MENHIDLVNTGRTIKHHFGWQDFNDLATKTSPVTLTANTWADLPNDGLGTFTNVDHKILDHSLIWSASTNSLNFSSLTLGDLVLLRLSFYVTTASSNVNISGKLRLGVGSSNQYDLPFFSGSMKHSGKHLVSTTTFVYIGNKETKSYPAKVAAMSDTTGTQVEVDGWAVATLRRN